MHRIPGATPIRSKRSSVSGHRERARTWRRSYPFSAAPDDVALQGGDHSDGVFRFSEGAVYPALHRLERDGLVRSRWTAAGPRRRRVYRITRAGREGLALRRLEWKTFVRAVESVLAASGRDTGGRR